LAHGEDVAIGREVPLEERFLPAYRPSLPADLLVVIGAIFAISDLEKGFVKGPAIAEEGENLRERLRPGSVHVVERLEDKLARSSVFSLFDLPVGLTDKRFKREEDRADHGVVVAHLPDDAAAL
jgi:hypothetical protein